MTDTLSAPSSTPLNDAALPQLAERLQVPGYDRSALTPAVVHVSVGGFTRAHQLVYFDELARQGETGWGVVGVGLHTSTMRDALAPQDHLFTVVERDADEQSARVVGSMVDYLFAPDAPGRVQDLLADERTRLVTMTLTGSAYAIDPQTGEFEPDEETRSDLEHPDRPQSVFGYLVEALDRRRRAGLPPFTVLSCDNMQSNGSAARTAVLGYARLRDEVLARWIADHVSFPSSMVDRITPSTSAEQRAEIADTYGVDDGWPVLTEPFTQWVVQDDFCNGRPTLETVGVRFVEDVADHEMVKTRLLNAGHVVLGCLGQLAGVGTTDEAIGDPVLAGFVHGLMGEVLPLLPEPAGVDLTEYRETLLRRFANPAISDPLSRLSRRGSQKMTDFVLPSLHQARARGLPHELLTLAVAGWIRFLEGTDETGRPLEVQDARRERLQELVRQGGTDPRPLLAERELFGDLSDDEDFAAHLQADLEQLATDGVRATLAARLAGSDDAALLDQAQPA